VLSQSINALEAIFTNQVLARRLAHAHAVELQEYCEERAKQRLDQVVEWL
jgi:hypothetical protein